MTVKNSQELDLAVRRGLDKAAAHASRVVLLVPGFAETLHFRRLLSDTPLSFGVTVSSFDSWIDDRWELYGDGRTVVSPAERELLVGQVLKERKGEGLLRELTISPGTVKLLAHIAQEALSVFTGEEPSPSERRQEADMRFAAVELTAAEHEVVDVLRAYAATLDAVGFCERVQAMAALKAMPAEGLSLVLAGFDELSYVRGLFLDALAQGASVQVMADDCKSPVAVPGRADELVELQRAVFKPDPEHPIDPTGAVRFLLPSGRYAASLLIAEELVACLEGLPQGSGEEGHEPCTAVLVARDPERLFFDLVPYLDARGISCAYAARKSFSATEFGKAFGALVRFLVGTSDSTFLVSDFASSPFSGLSQYRANELDAAWRGDRSCDKGRCLADLAAQSSSFSQVLKAWETEGAVAALHVFERAVNARFDWPEAYRSGQQAAIATALRYMEAAEDLGGDPLEALSLLEQASVPCSAAYGSGGLAVHMMTLDEAACLPACSYDYAFSCDMDSQSFPVQARQTAETLLFEKLGLAEPVDALVQARKQFFRFLSVPLCGLVCERVLNTVEASSAYPSVMFEEVADCYRSDLVSSAGVDAGTGLADALVSYTKQAGEERLYENLALSQVGQNMLALDPLPPSGSVGNKARSLIVLPPKSSFDTTGKLFLSPSAIESYLECPLKWFTLRRLRLQGLDAGFGALEMGSFSHRVLKSSYQQLKDEGILKIDHESLAYAREVLDAVFERHIALQSRLRRDDNPLIACTPLEEVEVAELKKKLMRFLDREAVFLPGFAPRFFERNFGDREAFDYAGTMVHGCIDRIDVNDRGQAVVIDYKGSVSKDFAYASASELPWVASDAPIVLPYRIQTLIYAQAAKKTLGLEVVAALYVSYGRDARISGSYDRTVLDASDLPGIDVEACGVSPEQGGGFAEVLDRTEDSIAQALAYLQEGFIEPWPLGSDPCAFCPVQVCEKRRLP